MPKCCGLHELRAGDSGRVAEILGDPQQVMRLYEVGFRIGADFQMLQTGRACVIRVAGTKLCLRPMSVHVMIQPH